MSIYLEITQLENGDIVLREAEDDVQTQGEAALAEILKAPGAAHPDREPLVRISFSEEVKDMLGSELVGIAEAMIDAATDFLGGESVYLEADPDPEQDPESPVPPIVH